MEMVFSKRVTTIERSHHDHVTEDLLGAGQSSGYSHSTAADYTTGSDLNVCLKIYEVESTLSLQFFLVYSDDKFYYRNI